MTAIHPQQFVDQPLFLKTICEGTENDLAIHCAGHLVGRIRLTPTPGGVQNWLSIVTVPWFPPLAAAQQERSTVSKHLGLLAYAVSRPLLAAGWVLS